MGVAGLGRTKRECPSEASQRMPRATTLQATSRVLSFVLLKNGAVDLVLRRRAGRGKKQEAQGEAQPGPNADQRPRPPARCSTCWPSLPGGLLVRRPRGRGRRWAEVEEGEVRCCCCC